MEDIRSYRDDEEEREEQSDNPMEWELARLGNDEEPPFHLPRD